MRKLSIYLMVIGGLLILGSALAYGYVLTGVYKLAGSCAKDFCKEEEDKLATYENLAKFGRAGGLIGFSTAVAGVVVFRKAENQTHRNRIKDKLIY